MKKIVLTSAFFFACSIILLSSCSTTPDGWYHMDEKGENITGKPFATPKDFTELQIDSFTNNGKTQYAITGRIKPEKLNQYADETEKAIGKYIGFVHNGKVITKPMVNMRIETGGFLISLPDINNREEVRKIYNALVNAK